MDLFRMFGNISSKGMDTMAKAVVVYYSSTGTNYQLAQWAEAGAKEAGADVKLLKIPETAPQAAIDSNELWKTHSEKTKHVPEATPQDLVDADAIIFSVPTRFGNIASQVQSFIDTLGGVWAQGQLANKAVSAMSTAQNTHGGQEATILSLYTTMYHWGAIVVAPGYTDSVIYESGGNPYGTSATAGQDGIVGKEEAIKASVLHQAKRTIQVAKALKHLE